MSSREFVIDEEFRMKAVNFLKMYGDYGGELSKADVSKRYISGELKLIDIINSKWEFKLLKASVNFTLDYCYENSYNEIEDVIKFFYKKECVDVRKKYGGLFDKF